MSNLVLRSKIDQLEECMQQMPNQVAIEDIEVKHHFTNNGLYAREMIIPKGMLITGRVKKHEHISVLSAGFVTEVTEAGVQHIKAPYTMVSLPGTKRVVLAHETTVWTTIHATKETDLAKVEADLIVCSDEEYSALLKVLEETK